MRRPAAKGSKPDRTAPDGRELSWAVKCTLKLFTHARQATPLPRLLEY